MSGLRIVSKCEQFPKLISIDFSRNTTYMYAVKKTQGRKSTRSLKLRRFKEKFAKKNIELFH